MHFEVTLADLGFLEGRGNVGNPSGIITERNFLVQWRRQDLARGGAQNDIEMT